MIIINASMREWVIPVDLKENHSVWNYFWTSKTETIIGRSKSFLLEGVVTMQLPAPLSILDSFQSLPYYFWLSCLVMKHIDTFCEWSDLVYSDFIVRWKE